MPIVGPEKDRLNWVKYRMERQKEFWPDYVKKLDAESNGHHFRSEILSYEELWNLYVGGASEEPNPEEESRGKKAKKVDSISAVIPIKTFELPGRYSEKGIHHRGEDDTQATSNVLENAPSIFVALNREVVDRLCAELWIGTGRSRQI